jgi:hypothetical protein
METSQLASHCKELLLTRNRVSLGTLGSFIAEDIPASFTRDSHILLPPGRRISFKASETWNDGLLENAVESKAELNELLVRINHSLNKEKSVTLEDFGKLRRTKEGDIFFVIDKSITLNPGGFGLVPLSLSPLEAPSKIKSPVSPPKHEELTPAETPPPALASSDRDTKQRHLGGMWITLGIILLIVILVLIVYVFREPLRPLLETILYSRQERSLL